MILVYCREESTSNKPPPLKKKGKKKREERKRKFMQQRRSHSKCPQQTCGGDEGRKEACHDKENSRLENPLKVTTRNEHNNKRQLWVHCRAKGPNLRQQACLPSTSTSTVVWCGEEMCEGGALCCRDNLPPIGSIAVLCHLVSRFQDLRGVENEQ